MAKKNVKSANIGRTKVSTDDMIEGAVARQNSWMASRRDFAKRFLRKLNIFARSSTNSTAKIARLAAKNAKKLKRIEAAAARKETKSGVGAYWFPILCAVIVLAIGVWVAFVRSDMNVKKEDGAVVVKTEVTAPVVPEPVVKKINKKESKTAAVKTVVTAKSEKSEKPVVVANVVTPSFDIVRIDKEGNVVIAGRWLPNKNVSIVVNGKVVATEHTDANGEFAYTPKHPFNPGNYTIRLIGTETNTKSENDVFIYVSERGYADSVSLLMTKDGSKLMQVPMLKSGDLVVSKIDYLSSGRIVVTGNALPRLRVSLTMNDKYLGFAHVSDYKYFGLGSDVEKLEPGKEYTLVVRLHDGQNKTVAEVKHTFTMPKPTGADDTFYTVRRGDCLWIISRNFLSKGILFSIIAQENNIKNPNLIFPKQNLKIPVKGK